MKCRRAHVPGASDSGAGEQSVCEGRPEEHASAAARAVRGVGREQHRARAGPD